MTTSVMWFRRDLRISDNPALLDSLRKSDDVLPLFVFDDRLRKPSGAPRLAFLYGSLAELNERVGDNLVTRTGDPVEIVAEVAREVGATDVYCTDDFGPYGRTRDDAVEVALEKDDVTLHRVDSPYAIEPGAVVKNDGSPFQVFTPFSRSWQAHGWGSPANAPRSPKFVSVKSEGIPNDVHVSAQLPAAGERAGQKRLTRFLDERVPGYKAHRDEPAAGATSRLSPYLKYGCIHPRQALAKLGNSLSEQTFRNELCWREFYADVLFHRPDTTGHAYLKQMAAMQLDEGKRADQRFERWSQGLTGYPIVDAGMRQLLGEAWMHNRVRMIVASFLIKDLHIDWTRGAKYFMQHLVDGDLASNTHGWQWVAGTGTDAAPYFRIFNPVTQGKKFDSDAAYIRKYIPELRDLEDKYIHEPWKTPGGPPNAYPAPIVDHDTERREALRRYKALRRG